MNWQGCIISTDRKLGNLAQPLRGDFGHLTQWSLTPISHLSPLFPSGRVHPFTTRISPQVHSVSRPQMKLVFLKSPVNYWVGPGGLQLGLEKKGKYFILYPSFKKHFQHLFFTLNTHLTLFSLWVQWDRCRSLQVDHFATCSSQSRGSLLLFRGI